MTNCRYDTILGKIRYAQSCNTAERVLDVKFNWPIRAHGLVFEGIRDRSLQLSLPILYVREYEFSAEKWFINVRRIGKNLQRIHQTGCQ